VIRSNAKGAVRIRKGMFAVGSQPIVYLTVLFKGRLLDYNEEVVEPS
jgi:hypothetical protein